MSAATQTHWLGKLSNLNVAKTQHLGVAPHKPLMIFSLMDLIESAVVQNVWISYDADLVTRFRDYWAHVVDRRKNLPDITMPFNALGSDRDAIWERFDEHGNPSKSKLTTRLCRLDADLFECLQDAAFRQVARRTLVATYFTPPEQASLCARFGFAVPNTEEMKSFQRDRQAFSKSQRAGRSIKFRADVGSLYKYTCALTGYCLSSPAGYIVQACHIHEHSKSGDDDVRNGLALTPDAHWMFDKGLWTAVLRGDILLIKVAAGRFRESSPAGRSLAEHEGKPLHFHMDARLRPGAEQLEWHRRHHGFQ